VARSTKELYEIFKEHFSDLSEEAHALFKQLAPMCEEKFLNDMEGCHNGEEFMRFLGVFVANEIRTMLEPLVERLSNAKAFDQTGTEILLPDSAKEGIVGELQRTAVAAVLKGFLETAFGLGIVSPMTVETDFAGIFGQVQRNLN
jgi:hypothetical protein